MAVPELVGEVDWSGDPTASFYDTLINTPGVQSYWRMADGGATLTDAKGLNNGTLEGSPSLVTGALPHDTNQALSFNGTSQDAYVPTSGSLETTGDFTLQGWVRFASLPGAVKLLVGKQGSWSVS